MWNFLFSLIIFAILWHFGIVQIILGVIGTLFILFGDFLVTIAGT